MNDLVSVGCSRRPEANNRRWGVVSTPEYVEECRQAGLDSEQTWPHLDFINPVDYLEGEFVGFFLGVPYDWDILDPHLMRKGDEKHG